MKTPSPYVIEAKAQFAALASSARQELVDVLQRLGTVSVAEIASALDRPADGLYYHLRVLQRAGLVMAAGHRRENGRDEATFRAVSPMLTLRQEPRSPERGKAINAIVGSMLRLGIRDFRRAFKDPDVSVSGDARDLWALRTTGWLTREQVVAVNRLIRRLAREVSRAKQPGRLYGVTLLFTPLAGKGRNSRRTHP